MNIINKHVLSELESHITHDKFIRNIQTFMTYLPVQIVELESMSHGTDMQKVADMAHMLKGTCGQFGAMRLHEIFKAIEVSAEEHRMHDVEVMVRVLPYEFQLVQELIDLSYMATDRPQRISR